MTPKENKMSESENQDVQTLRAVEDAEFIKQVLNKFEASKMRKNPHVLKAQLVIDIGLLVFSGLFLAVELVTSSAMTKEMYASVISAEFQKEGILNLGIMLSLMVLLLYITAWSAWKKSSMNFSSFLEKNFNYLKRLSLAANLSVKFFALSLIILSGRIDFVAPLLVVFIFDELYHNRIFNMSFKEGVAFGILSLGLAAYLLATQTSSIAWALGLFFAISLFSLFRTIRDLRKLR